MNYEIIADSGSTKTDWAVLRDGRLIATARTAGLNPFQMSGAEIEAELSAHLLPALPAEVTNKQAPPAPPHSEEGNTVGLHFYGAGCTPEKQPVVEHALRTVLPSIGHCEVASDMLGAARAVCGAKPGIACILGTGSNSCAYDGHDIVKNVPALGFILGDEGSGAVMGKTLVADVLKSQLPKHVCDRFFSKYHLTQADIIDRVYRQPKPNTFLASFVPFLEENIAEPAIERLVKDSFRAFIRRNVMQYDGYDRLPIGFVGSIAAVYRPQLEAVAAEEGITLGRIIKAPLDALTAK